MKDGKCSVRELSFLTSASPTVKFYQQWSRRMCNVAFDAWITNGEDPQSSRSRSHPRRPGFGRQPSLARRHISSNLDYIIIVIISPVVDNVWFEFIFGCSHPSLRSHMITTDLECGIRYFRHFVQPATQKKKPDVPSISRTIHRSCALQIGMGSRAYKTGQSERFGQVVEHCAKDRKICQHEAPMRSCHFCWLSFSDGGPVPRGARRYERMRALFQ
ncbi:hypothetical protein BGW80DRAFT_220936 [Lactifluus volemus]|nr:hypothetical protein BGW80DRAFT_220936 [Lactifluus volemus]